MKNTNLKKCFTASLLGIIALGGYAQVNYVEPPIMGWTAEDAKGFIKVLSTPLRAYYANHKDEENI